MTDENQAAMTRERAAGMIDGLLDAVIQYENRYGSPSHQTILERKEAIISAMAPIEITDAAAEYEHLKHMVLVRPHGLDRAAAIWALNEINWLRTRTDMQALPTMPSSYRGISYEAASREAERLIQRHGWFQSLQQLNFLADIMRRHNSFTKG